MKYLLLVLVSILNYNCETKKDMKEQHKQIVESYIRAYNNFDIDGMTSNLDENIVFENISNGKLDLRTEGLKNFVEQAELVKQYFKLKPGFPIPSFRFTSFWAYESLSFRGIYKYDNNDMINIDYKAVRYFS